MIADLIAETIFRPRNATLENPALSLNDPKAWDEVLGGSTSEAGTKVTHGNALNLSAMWQGVSVLSGDVATMTLNVKRIDGEDRETDEQHEAQAVCARQWNEWTPAFQGWRRLMAHAVLWPSGYAWLQRRGRSASGKLLAMVNLLPDRTAPAFDDNGDLFYVTEVDGDLVPLMPWEVFQLHGLSLENFKGCDMVMKARDSLGLAMAREAFESKFFAHGAQAGGILEIPAGISAQAKAKLEEGFDKKYAGKEHWFKTLVLRDGAKFHQLTVDAQKSQLTESKEEDKRAVAGWLCMPPWKLGVKDSVSYNSAEQDQLSYLNGALNHWRSAIVGEGQIKLLKSDPTRLLEHNVSKLIELDTKTLNEVLEIQRRNEIINANDWRRKTGMKTRTDPEAETYVNPNTKSAPSGAPQDEPPRDSAVEAAHRALIRDAVDRMARRVAFQAKTTSKSPTKFLAWLDSKCQDQRKLFDEAVRPAMTAHVTYSGGELNNLCYRAETEFFTSFVPGLDGVASTCTADALVAGVESFCAQFEGTIADKVLAEVCG